MLATWQQSDNIAGIPDQCIELCNGIACPRLTRFHQTISVGEEIALRQCQISHQFALAGVSDEIKLVDQGSCCALTENNSAVETSSSGIDGGLKPLPDLLDSVTYRTRTERRWDHLGLG
ncbi:hypothetical protein SU48_01615 [Deinococcus puniceus]|uniref:Uncharacterized protein n=1 Tax=Deinococcus puniceus TaxID=1182568 RepID=A0A172T6U3_9DEIO|nr:hypothetical protein SU48_01615 [Deinococcus puniceus]